MHFAVLTFAKISQGWVRHRIPAANDQSKWFQQKWMQIIHIVQFPCWKIKPFLFARIILEKIASSETWRWGILHCFPVSQYCFPAQVILRQSINLCKDNLAYRLQSLHTIDNISYLLQSLDKQSLLCNYYISALAFSLLQIRNKPSFLLVLIATQIIFPTCFNPR